MTASECAEIYEKCLTNISADMDFVIKFRNSLRKQVKKYRRESDVEKSN